jgi:hypothetical protein
MHLPAGNDIDPGHFLFQDGRLHRTKLRVDKVTFGQLAERDQTI